MSNRQRHPDAEVIATDRDGRRKNIQNLYLHHGVSRDPFDVLQDQISEAKRHFMERYGPDCYTFVNIYC